MRIKLYENRDFMRRTQIKLMQEEVHIWCIRWKEVIPVFEYYQLMLDQKEKEKMEEYYFYEDRMRYVAGKVITKLVLIQYLEEEEISFLSHKFGKPYYKSISGKQDIEFNISHSSEMILVAFSRDAKIGVDIQEIIDCSEYLEIARSFFEPEEVKNIEESNSKELFFQYWSAKEAYLKAIGVGLLKGMSATERMNDLYTTIERPNGQLMEHQRKMLNVLFRVFAQNFRCVSSYIPKVYTGKMRVFDCESAIANFFPSLFSEDKKTWEQYAQGEFLFDTMKGDHISCMNSPYIEENVKKILDL